MAYITNEEVAKKRAEIKKAFPKWKFSITRKNYSTLRVSILEADIQLTEKTNEPVNQYYIKDHYKDKPEVMEALQKIADIMLKGEEVAHVCSDYGSIPNFYVSLSIGEWDKPFVYKPKV
jgi:hypothetical protein